MKTFSEKLKQHWIDTMQDHQDADRLEQGRWWDNGDKKGCFFGCAMQTDRDALQKAIEHMQLPAWLVHLAEAIFEGLPADDALLFPVQLLEAIPANTDISEVMHTIAVKRIEPLIIETNGNGVNNAIQQVIDYHKNTERTEDYRKKVLLAANSALSAARSARSVRSAALSAVYSAVYSSAYSYSAKQSAWQRERDNLLQALKEFKK